jgi:hypothetical protein
MNKNSRNATRQLVTPNLSKNSFDISNFWLGTTRIGKITPVRFDDVTPNSHWRIRTNFRAKFAPIIYPFNHRVDGCIYTAFVPYRLMMISEDSTYGGWSDYIMGDPQSRFGSNILPYTTIDDSLKTFYYRGTLQDHLGLPALDGQTVHSDGEQDIHILPQIAYHMIYDEFMRNPWTQERDCGIGSAYNINLQVRDYTGSLAVVGTHKYANYDADYIMGALPAPYAGSSSDVEIDLDIISSVGEIILDKDTGANPTAGALTVTAAGRIQDSTPNDLQFAQTGLVLDNYGSTLEILELRRAQALTRFLEAENRSGEEYYDDWLKSMFGHDVDMSYARPIYLGGTRQAINVTEVLSTAETYDYSSNDLTSQQTLNPQGSQVGHAMASAGSGTINFYAKEPGILMTLFVLKPVPMYHGGIEKYWLKTDRTEFYNYNFQGIGDQEILYAERGYDCSSGATNTNTWGYAGRWDEYKHKQNIFCGDYTKSGLEAWHLGILHDVSGPPVVLSSTNTLILPGNDENLRIFADQTETDDEVWLQVYNDVQVILPMYKTDIPQ